MHITQLVTAMKCCKVQHIITSCDPSFWEVPSQNFCHVHFLVPPPQPQQNHLHHSGIAKVNIIENKRAESVAHIAAMWNTLGVTQKASGQYFLLSDTSIYVLLHTVPLHVVPLLPDTAIPMITALLLVFTDVLCSESCKCSLQLLLNHAGVTKPPSLQC